MNWPVCFQDSISVISWRSERTTNQSQVTDMAVRENHQPVTSHWHGGQREPPTSHKSLTWWSERTTDQSQVTDMAVRENHRPVTSHWHGGQREPVTSHVGGSLWQPCQWLVTGRWFSLTAMSVTCDWLVVLSDRHVSDLWLVGGSLWPPWYNWNTVESDVKHHSPNPFMLCPFIKIWLICLWYIVVLLL
jgi:hypothetical protein